MPLNGADPKEAESDDADVSAEVEVRGDESSTENAAPVVYDGGQTFGITVGVLWALGFVCLLIMIIFGDKSVQRVLGDNIWRREYKSLSRNISPQYKVWYVIAGVADVTWLWIIVILRQIIYKIILGLITYPDGFPTSHVWYRSYGARLGVSLGTTLVLIIGIITPLAVLDTYRRRELVWKTYLIRENERAKGQFKRVACKLWRDGKQSGEDLEEVAEKMQKIIAGMPVAMPVERGETISAYPQTESWQSGSAGIHVDQYRMFSPGVEVEEKGEEGESDKFALKEANLNENLVQSTSNNLHVYGLIDATTLKNHVAIDADQDGTTCGPDDKSCALLKSMKDWCADDLPVENLYGSKVKNDEEVDPYKPEMEKVESDDEEDKKKSK